ncbi:MAG TPA: gliding motility-associated C-terminal domain-containing protein, partial [Puia sp.]|nr:gliding motility-associated C-terminal domain-containing protein [Puia sp.]
LYDSNFQIKVTVAPIPIVSAQKSNDIDCNNPSAQLTATGAETYSWTPASGVNDPNKSNPIASIDTSTTFLVKGTDKNECSSSGSVSVNVSSAGKASFLIPNSLTPNGDGHNDCFGIRRWGFVTIKEFSIYNRWGQRIFTTTNPSDCWDGTFKGVPQPVGGYPYAIKAKSFCGDIIRKGIVLLIR